MALEQLWVYGEIVPKLDVFPWQGPTNWLLGQLQFHILWFGLKWPPASLGGEIAQAHMGPKAYNWRNKSSWGEPTHTIDPSNIYPK